MQVKQNSLLLIYVTCKNEAEAKTIARECLSLGLCACANIIPRMISIYKWENQVQEDNETLLLLKSSEEQYSELQKKILELHSYTTPCVVSIKIQNCNEAYSNWLLSQLKD